MHDGTHQASGRTTSVTPAPIQVAPRGILGPLAYTRLTAMPGWVRDAAVHTYTHQATGARCLAAVFAPHRKFLKADMIARMVWPSLTRTETTRSPLVAPP